MTLRQVKAIHDDYLAHGGEPGNPGNVFIGMKGGSKHWLSYKAITANIALAYIRMKTLSAANRQLRKLIG